MGFLLLNRSAHTHEAGTEQVHRAAQAQLCPGCQQRHLFPVSPCHLPSLIYLSCVL